MFVNKMGDDVTANNNDDHDDLDKFDKKKYVIIQSTYIFIFSQCSPKDL